MADSDKWDSEDLATVKIKVLLGHKDSVTNCQFVQDSQTVFSASADKSVRLWGFRDGKCIKSYENLHNSDLTKAHCVPNGSKFLTCGLDKKLKLWDTETGTCLLDKVHDDFLTCCQVSYNEKLVACGSDLNSALRVYDLTSGQCVYDIQGHHDSTVTSCRFNPTDDKVITTSNDKTVRFFDLVTGTQTIKLVGHKNIISSCCITKDERKFVTAAWDKTVLIWDVATGMYRSKGPIALKAGHDGSINSCNFSSDGLFLVTASNDLSVVVWDVENEVQKMKLQGHYGWINDACFSDDQNWLVSCAKDKTVRLWNIEDSDKVPAVLENKMAQGVKVIKD